MATYTRQSTASIVNGTAITAAPLNAEFNQLLAVFHATTGHTHTGATGDGTKIPLATSVSGFLPAENGGTGGKSIFTNTSNPGVGDDSADGFAPGSLWENTSTGRVYICVGNNSGAAVWRELVQVESGNAIIPASGDAIDLGNTNTRFQDLFLSGGISATGNTAFGGTLNVTGNTGIGGTLGVTGLGTFDNLTATGTTTITSIDLNSGAIDNTTIGTSTPAAGTFTTLNANTSLVAATADINGGTVDGATIGASTPSTGAFTTLGASGTSTLATVDINAGAIDGTVIGANNAVAGSFTTISTSGAATLASVDINGGSMDGTVIGANSAAAITGTTITGTSLVGPVTGNITGNTAGVHTGAVIGDVSGDLAGNVTASSGSSTFNNVVVNGNLNMNAGTSATITNLTAPSADLDAATKKYVDDEISTLVGDAGSALDTLGELSDALNDDASFSATVTSSIATKLPKAGGTMSGAIAMGTNKITGAGDPTANQDVATKVYTDTQRDTRLATAGGTMSGAIAMGNNKVTGLATPTAGTDATTKTYVDTIHGSAVAAATSASNASTSASNAATSETNASNSASAASSSATSAAASFDLFDDRMLGAKSSAPTVDNDGNALVVGTLYFDTTAGAMKVYSASGWTNAGSSVNGTTNRYSYTATAGQTVFAATYDAGYVDIFLNGVKQLVGTDVTATSGTSVVFSSGTSVNDIVEIVGYGTFVLADHPTQTQADARYVNLSGNTMTGDLTVPNLVVSGLVDGVDIAARDAVLTTTTNTANAALPKAGGTMTGALTTTGQTINNAGQSQSALSIGGGSTNAALTLRGSTGSAYAWQMSSNAHVASALEFTRSTAVGGTTFSTPSLVIGATGEILQGVTSASSTNISATFAGTENTTSVASGNGAAISIKNKSTTDNSYSTLYFENSAGGIDSGIYGIHGNADGTGSSRIGSLVFATANSGGGVAERMRIDSSGNVGIGITAPSFENGQGLEIRYAGGNGAHLKLTDNASGAGGTNGFDLYAFNTSGYIENYEAGSLVFRNNGAERMRINAAGQISMGNATNTHGTLTINNSAASGDGLYVRNSNGAAYDLVTLGPSYNSHGATANQVWFYSGQDINIGGATSNTNSVRILGGGAERMKVTSAGHITTQYGSTSGYGQTSGNGGFAFVNDLGSTGGAGIFVTNAARAWSNLYINRIWSSGQDTRFMQFAVNGSGATGYIRVASASTMTYETSSDYRLKENVVYDWDATTRLKQLKPARFNFILDGTDVTQDGFMAHEAQEVVPIAVSGVKDAMRDEEYEVTPAVLDDDGNETTAAVMGTRSVPDMQGIDHSMLVPLLVKTIQELEARITVLEAG